MMYLVTYSTVDKFISLRFLGAVKEHFKKWAILSDNVCIVVSDETVVEVREYLKSFIKKEDKLFVTKISAPAAWNGYPKQMNDWLLQTYQKDKNDE